jgi:TolB-like protein/Flp pilus assembly protein TadD
MSTQSGRRLDSWKEIASYLGREVRTAIRWEKGRGLPVHRIPGGKGGVVFAFADEVDAWLHKGSAHPDTPAALAVLPFLNFEYPEKSEISDAISQTIISTLSRLPKLRVMSWSTVSRFREEASDPRTVGRDLNATTVMTGRISQRNSFWQVSVELVDPADGAQLWGRHYSLPVVDLQMLPNRIASDALDGMDINLSAVEAERLVPEAMIKPEAYMLCLQGRYHIGLLSLEGLKRAIECLQQAIALEPNYAQAYAELAYCYTYLGLGYGDLPSLDMYALADEAARRAIELDDSLGEAHCSLALASPHRGWDCGFVERELRRAIELAPSYSPAHLYYAMLLMGVGRYEEGIEEMEWAVDLDPKSPLLNGDLAFDLALAGRLEEAHEQIQDAMRKSPGFPSHRYILGVVYERKGMYREAIAEMEQAVRSALMHTVPLGVLGYLYAATGEREKARQVLRRLDELAKSRSVSHFSQALVCAGLGESSEALRCLEKAYEEHSPFLYMLNFYPWLESLRLAPEFADLVKRVGLPATPTASVASPREDN